MIQHVRSVALQGWPLECSLRIVRMHFRHAGCRKGLRLLSHAGNAINKIIEDFLDNVAGGREQFYYFARTSARSLFSRSCSFDILLFCHVCAHEGREQTNVHAGNVAKILLKQTDKV